RFRPLALRTDLRARCPWAHFAACSPSSSDRSYCRRRTRWRPRASTLLTSSDRRCRGVRAQTVLRPAAGLLGSVRQGLLALWRVVPLRAVSAASLFSVMGWGTLNVGFPAYALAVSAGAHASS